MGFLNDVNVYLRACCGIEEDETELRQHHRSSYESTSRVPASLSSLDLSPPSARPCYPLLIHDVCTYLQACCGIEDADETELHEYDRPSYRSTSTVPASLPGRHPEKQHAHVSRPAQAYAPYAPTRPPQPSRQSSQPYQPAQSTPPRVSATYKPYPALPSQTAQPPRYACTTPPGRPAEPAAPRPPAPSFPSANTVSTRPTYPPQLITRQPQPHHPLSTGVPVLRPPVVAADDADDQSDSDIESVSDIQSIRQLRVRYKDPEELRALARKKYNHHRRNPRSVERCNAMAARWVFSENNQGRADNEIDLHGLHVREALDHVEQAIAAARKSGKAQLNFIVGQGKHSANGVARIKPAVEEWLQKQDIAYVPGPGNPGLLIVTLVAET